jgi:hypothetical protein
MPLMLGSLLVTVTEPYPPIRLRLKRGKMRASIYPSISGSKRCSGEMVMEMSRCGSGCSTGGGGSYGAT